MRTINTISLLVHGYDEAIAFYTEKLGFQDLYGNLWDLIQHH